MDRVSVNPLKVRCLGNVVSPKTVSDFGTLNGTVSSSSDTVNNQTMTVYSTDYLVGSSISLSVGGVIGSDVDEFTVYATLKNNSNSAVSSATVYCVVNGVSASATTDANGVATFTVTTDGSDEYRIRCYYEGTVSLAGSSAYKVVSVAELSMIELLGTATIIETDETLDLFARVTDAVAGVPVSFYLESDDNRTVTSISLSASSSSVQPSGNVTLTGVLSAGTGKSVKVYANGSLVDTVTTTTDGAFSYTSSALTSDTSFYVVFDGDTSYRGCSSDSVSVSVVKTATTISLSSSSASVSYGGSFTLSGTLSAGSGLSVKIYNGSSLVATVTTGTGGAFSKQISNAGVGSYSYTAVFEENASYYGATSSAVAVTVTKATPTISLATSSASVSAGDSFTLSGTLSTGSGKSVKLYSGASLVDTLTTTTGGAFSKTITGASAGTYSYTAVYEGDTNYNSVTSSAVSVTVSAPSVSSITLASGDSVLSAYHNDKTDLIATVYDSNDNVLSGITVEFFKGSTSLGTATSDTNGVAMLYDAYTAVGAGDVVFTATDGSVTSSTVSVEDCIYYNSSEVSRTTTNGSTIYDSNMSVTLPSKCEISFGFWSNCSNSNGEHRFFLLPKSQFSTGTTQPQYALYIDQRGSNKGTLGKRENNSTVGIVSNFTLTTSSWHTVKWVCDGTSIGIYVDDTLKSTQTISWIGNYSDYCFSMMRWTSSGTSTMKNAKIKAL